MKLTTKGRYAVTALVDLAIHQQDEPMSICDVASRHGISPTYLERLAGILRAKGLLKSVRGAKGGYHLAKPADEITVADIIRAVDENMDATPAKVKPTAMKALFALHIICGIGSTNKLSIS